MNFEEIANIMNVEETTAAAKISNMLETRVEDGEPKTAWDVLVREGVLSRGVPLPLNDDSSSYEEDWSTIIYDQIKFIKEFVSTAVKFGLGLPPLNEEGSMVALAVYNATIEWSPEWESFNINIPSTRACFQEFWKLLIQK